MQHVRAYANYCRLESVSRVLVMLNPQIGCRARIDNHLCIIMTAAEGSEGLTVCVIDTSLCESSFGVTVGRC